MFEFEVTKRVIRWLLPWYVNCTLSVKEKRDVEKALEHDPVVQQELQDWLQVRDAVAGQPLRAPSPAVQTRLMTRIRSLPVSSHPAPVTALNWLGGLAISLAVALLLWLAVQPGMELNWSVNQAEPILYRIYRAEQGSDEFVLVDEIPAQSSLLEYSYTDAVLLPWQTYTYQVVGFDPFGYSSFSVSATASGLEILPGQMALLLTGLVVGYGVTLWFQYGQSPGYGRGRLAAR